MKIREVMMRSLKKIRGEDTIPILFPEFLINLSAIIVFTADQLLCANFPRATIGKDDAGGGKGVDISERNITSAEIESLLIGHDMMRRTSLFVQLYDFINWYLDQDVPSDETNWDEITFIGEKWNEFAMQEMERK